MARCDICLEEKEGSDLFFYKWHDADRNGADIEGFCCCECSLLCPEDQWEFMKQACAAKRTRDTELENG